MTSLVGLRVSGVVRAPIVDDALSRKGQMILSSLIYGASGNVWNVGERRYADAQGVRCSDRDLI